MQFQENALGVMTRQTRKYGETMRPHFADPVTIIDLIPIGISICA